MSTTDEGAQIALQEAREGLSEGGLPVGSAIIAPDDTVLGRGRNMRSANDLLPQIRTLICLILHGETAAFDSNRKLDQAAWKGATLYTTLSPCPMCAGAMIYFGIKKVVIGENAHMTGREEMLRNHGMEVVVLDDKACKDLMDEFIQTYPGKFGVSI